jgi:hypothetical protein
MARTGVETIRDLMEKPKVRLAPVNFDEICLRLGLQGVNQAKHMYGGNCPMCGGKKCFFVWLDHDPIRAVCYECGIDLSIKRNRERRWTKVDKG